MAPRLAIQLAADVTLPGDLTIESHTVDLSQTGMQIVAPYELQNDDVCEVTLRLPGEGQTPVTLVGRVRYCTPKPYEHFRVGLEFVGLDENIRRMLQQLCG